MKNAECPKPGTSGASAARPKPNPAKGKAYALAYDMIKAAMENGCPLQAITIEESILTDRLSSTLNVGKDKAEPCFSLGQVLQEWKGNPQKGVAPNASAILFDQEMTDLLPSFGAWWQNRNELLHGIVKSPCGSGLKTQAECFMEKARTVAEEGKNLTDQFVGPYARSRLDINTSDLSSFMGIRLAW